MQAHEEGGEASKGDHMGEGIGAPGARYVGEHVVVRALEGDGPLFVAADFCARDGMAVSSLARTTAKLILRN